MHELHTDRRSLSQDETSLLDRLREARSRFTEPHRPPSGRAAPIYRNAGIPGEPRYQVPNGEILPVSVVDRRAARVRERNTPLQRARRAALAADIAALTASMSVSPYRLPFRDRLRIARELRDWLRTDGPRQRQFRRRGSRDYLACKIALEEHRADRMDEPKPAALMRRIEELTGNSVDRMGARNLLKRVTILEEPEGPWERVVTANDEPSPGLLTPISAT